MKSKFILALSVAALTSCVLPAFAQNSATPAAGQPALQNSADPDLQARLQRIDSMVMQRMQELNLPGYSLSIIKNGKVVFQKPYGFQNVEAQQPTTNDTIFGLGSLTKTFTAISLLSLVDKGLLNLEDPVSKYVDGLAPAYKPLTIRQLASMTGGVPAQLSQEVAWKNQLEILNQTPLVSQPGSAFLYSNFSYRLLGSVIEKVTGQPYLQYVESTVCAPLDMRSTGTTVLLQPTGRVAQAYGDNMGKGPMRAIEYKSPAVAYSAGMLASTSNDLINYVFGLMGRKIVSPDAYKTMWYNRPPLTTGQPSKWAFGWANTHNKNLNGQLTIAMNGGVPGIASTIIILPDTNSAVIALCNLRKPPVYQIAKTAAAMAFGDGGGEANAQEEEHGTSGE